MPQLEQLPALLCAIVESVNKDMTDAGASPENAGELLRDRIIEVKALADGFGANCPDVAPLPQATP